MHDCMSCLVALRNACGKQRSCAFLENTHVGMFVWTVHGCFDGGSRTSRATYMIKLWVDASEVGVAIASEKLRVIFAWTVDALRKAKR